MLDDNPFHVNPLRYVPSVCPMLRPLRRKSIQPAHPAPRCVPLLLPNPSPGDATVRPAQQQPRDTTSPDSRSKQTEPIGRSAARVTGCRPRALLAAPGAVVSGVWSLSDASLAVRGASALCPPRPADVTAAAIEELARTAGKLICRPAGAQRWPRLDTPPATREPGGRRTAAACAGGPVRRRPRSTAVSAGLAATPCGSGTPGGGPERSGAIVTGTDSVAGRSVRSVRVNEWLGRSKTSGGGRGDSTGAAVIWSDWQW